MNFRYLSVFFITMCSIGKSGAVSYTNGINESAWHIGSSVFECRLEHHVPYYGRAIFSTRAGEASKFYLQALSSRFKAGQAEMVSRSPVWNRSNNSVMIGKVAVKRGKRPMWLNSTNTEVMLSELNKGREIQFLNNTWYGQKHDAAMQLIISGIGFRKSYAQYLDCLVGLLPANFDQLKRTALRFAPGKPDPAEVAEGLDSSNVRKLEQILTLVKHDNKIKRFYIDGHTSAPGERGDNLELSKVRAEVVSEYLKLRGIPEDWIVTRWHGERYPVASNETSAGRAKNRRVTLRLEKIEEIEVLPMASK